MGGAILLHPHTPSWHIQLYVHLYVYMAPTKIEAKLLKTHAFRTAEHVSRTNDLKRVCGFGRLKQAELN
jgi:hypothetical protein